MISVRSSFTMKLCSSLSPVSVALLVVCLTIGVGPASAQHFDDCLSPRDTGSDATVIVQDTVTTLFPNEASLEVGDEIALYTSDGTCAGSTTWRSSDDDASLSAAGPNASTTNEGTSGYEPGDTLKVKVWDESKNEVYDLKHSIEYEPCENKSSLCRDDGTYEESAIYSIVRLGAREAVAPPPTEITEFDVIRSENRARLEWTTATESDSARFEIQHRTPDAAWSTIEFVEGAGRSTQPQHYSHTVTNLSTGRHHFRLKHADDEGTTTHSDPVSVDVSMAEDHKLSRVTPNPIHSHGRLVLRLREAQAVKISLFNTLGQRIRILHQGRLSQNKDHVMYLDGSSLSNGRYLIRIKGETFTSTRPVTVVR